LTRAYALGVVWEWDEIEQRWLDGGRVAAGPEAVVAAFERLDRIFGREWIEQSRIGPAGLPTTGSFPVALDESPAWRCGQCGHAWGVARTALAVG
jgi:hypothetical protein